MPAPQELVFAPLGGVGEIGMNLSIYGVGDAQHRTWLAVDLGVSFAAEEHLPGVDLILPDIRYLVDERKNFAGLVLTHAHEDHFGALLDLWPRLKMPVYATPFTAALLEAKCASEPGAPKIPVNIVAAGQPVQCRAVRYRARHDGAFDPRIERADHPHAGGTVLHTGDWKIDPTPILGDPTDEKKLRALGEEGCLALVGDSTNAVREGRSPSEADVAKTIAELVKIARGPRRGDDICLERRALARRCRCRASRRPRGRRHRPRHGAHRADCARDRLSRRRPGFSTRRRLWLSAPEQGRGALYRQPGRAARGAFAHCRRSASGGDVLARATA